jgi:S1-C subfamily serine protease
MAKYRLRDVPGLALAAAWVCRSVAAFLVLGLWWSTGPIASAAPQEPGQIEEARDKASRASAPRRPAMRGTPAQTPIPSDDWTFRPTVVVRRGNTQGSGTIIASIDDEALVLTAAHVLGDSGPLYVELHRYNLGLEKAPAQPGAWPRLMDAQLAAIDRAADLAVLRLGGLAPLPYVARLAPVGREPMVDSLVTSIGIDLGKHLSSWSTKLVEALWFELNDNREERLFLITTRAPEHGRSGGGLFLPDGQLVGVCIGHAELVRGRRHGVFASCESIRDLLVDHHLTSVIARSERQRSGVSGSRIPPPETAGRNAFVTSHSQVTPTGAVGGRR